MENRKISELDAITELSSGDALVIAHNKLLDENDATSLVTSQIQFKDLSTQIVSLIAHRENSFDASLSQFIEDHVIVDPSSGRIVVTDDGITDNTIFTYSNFDSAQTPEVSSNIIKFSELVQKINNKIDVGQLNLKIETLSDEFTVVSTDTYGVSALVDITSAYNKNVVEYLTAVETYADLDAIENIPVSASMMVYVNDAQSYYSNGTGSWVKMSEQPELSTYAYELSNAAHYISGVVQTMGRPITFIGITTTDPATGVITIKGKVITEFNAGDITIYQNDGSSVEWIYDGSSWQKIGDETQYVVKGELVDADVKDDADIAQTKISCLVTDLANISANLSNFKCKTITVDMSDSRTVAELASAAYGSETYGNGDALVVKRKIGGSDSICQHTAYFYAGSAWAAFDGNYSANNVYLNEDLIFAGSYTLGNVKTSTTAMYTAAKGTSVADMLKNIFTQKLQPTTLNGASITVEITNNTAKEVGDTIVPKYKVTFSSGSFSYGSIDSDGNWVNGTGITTTSLTVGHGDDVHNPANSETTYTSTETIRYKDTSDYTVTGYSAWTASNKPATNMHTPSNYDALAANSSTKTASLYAGYRQIFIGSVTDTTTPIDSDLIRSLTGCGSAKSGTYTVVASPASGEIELKTGAKRIIVAVPKVYSGKSVTLVELASASYADITNDYKKQSATVPVKGYNNYDSTAEYDVWVYQPATIGSTEKHIITIG